MKAKLAVLTMLALLAFGAAAAWADTIVLEPGEYGTQVPIDGEYWTPGFTVSPDGQWMAYVGTPNNRIMIAPLGGGEPRLVFSYSQFGLDMESGDSHPNYVYGLCFTPDSSEITFCKTYFDPDMNSSLIPTTGGYTVNNPCTSIESVNIYTGENRILGTGNYPRWDPTGRYLVYRNYDHRVYIDPLTAENERALMVLDTVTDERIVIRDQNKYSYFCPSADGRYIYYNLRAENAEPGVGTQFYRVPITGGEPEQISFLDDFLWVGISRLFASPDGNFLFYNKIWDIPSYYSRPNGGYSSGQYSSGLNVFNLNTGESTVLISHSDNLQIYPEAITGDGKALYVWINDAVVHQIEADKIWRCTFDPANLTLQGDISTPVAEEVAPAAFPTVANYPNPFNPATTIAFTLPAAGRTELQVYNIMGQRVRTLVSAELPAGAHEVVWDGRDDTGNPVSSGVFVTRLRSGELVVSNRMTLVK